jgi:hypothetical protein
MLPFFVLACYLVFMNPNLKIFFKRAIYVLVFGALIAAGFYGIRNVTDIDFSVVGEYLMNVFVGIMVTAMIVLILGVVLRAVWTGIMNRVDTIIKCCPDKQQDGVHIIASHYSPGGESTEGFSTYFHYYLDQKGKLYLSKKVEDDGNKIEKSILDLSEQTRLPLAPDLERAVRVGSYSDDDNKIGHVTMPIRKGELSFRGYERLIDYGFKVTYTAGGQTKWRVTI